MKVGNEYFDRVCGLGDVGWKRSLLWYENLVSNTLWRDDLEQTDNDLGIVISCIIA